MASLGIICKKTWDFIWGIIKAILWIAGIFYVLPIVAVVLFDLFEFLMLGDFTLSKFNWIASVQKVFNFYPVVWFQAQEMLRNLKR